MTLTTHGPGRTRSASDLQELAERAGEELADAGAAEIVAHLVQHDLVQGLVARGLQALCEASGMTAAAIDHHRHITAA